jgi:hypothetical protein
MPCALAIASLPVAYPIAQATWAENNYAQVKTELDAVLPACEQKVVAALADLLKD